MGTTLTGTTPQDTYDSLIKVTDNGPLSGTAKYLSDGLGNDSALALSTARVGIGTDSPSYNLDITAIGYGIQHYADASNSLRSYVGSTYQVLEATTPSGVSQFGYVSNNFYVEAGGSERMRITSAGKVGINTTSALGQLNIKNESAGATTNALALYNTPSNTENTGVAIEFYPNVGVDDRCARISSVNPTTTGTNLSDLRFFTSNNAAPTEKMRIDSSGNVGIGTTPTVKLDVAETLRVINTGESVFYLNNSVVQHQIAITADPSNKLAFRWNGTEGMALTPFGLTFNGDTAAANALDDYEEGTWTPSLAGCTFSGTITGNYTKIGRQVFIQMQFINATISGASGAAEINGLPFTSASGPHNAISITYADSLPSGDSGYVGNNATVISMRSGTGASSTTWINGTNNKSIMLTASYFV